MRHRTCNCGRSLQEFLRRQTIRENANFALNALIALVLIVLLLRVTG